MEKKEAVNQKEISDLMQYLNCCHDASLRTISFIKKREFDKKSGDLIYTGDSSENAELCDVHLEMLLNSYSGAKKDQVVDLEFKNVANFNFMQEDTYDYSEIYSVKCTMKSLGRASVVFEATKSKYPVLALECSKVICVEK